MAGLLEDLLSGRSSDIYGAGLLTPEQRGGIGNIGLLALAGKLGQLAGPSFSPVPDFGAALGQAAGAYGASQEGAGTAALNAILTAQKGRKLQQELDYYKQLGPVLGKLAGQWPGADGGAAATPETGTSGYMAASPGAGGGGSANGTYWTPEGLAALRPTEGRYDQIHYPGGNPSTATGAYGFLDSTWREQAAKAGVDINQYPRAYLAPPAVQDRVAAITPIHHWTGVDAQGKPFNAAAQRLATNPNYVAGAAPTAAAPVGTGTSGLLAPTAPNPLSDAEPMVGIPRPRVGPQAAAALPTSVPGASPEDTANAILQGWRGNSYLTPQGPAGDVGPPGPAGPATPRAPLPTMGPAGIELPPMQGPLAAPAPAAAAPAAPGPGLLSPPGMPAAPALPRVNPAYDTYLRNLGVAGVLAKGAGLPDVFGPLTGALKDSPAYQAQVELAKRLGVLPLIGPEEAAKKGVELQYAPQIAGATAEATKAVELRYAEALAAAAARGNLPSQLILKTVEAQNEFKNRMAPLGAEVTFDKDGRGTITELPGAAKTFGATAGETTRAQEQAKADVAAGTAPGIARETETQKGFAAQDTAARAQALASREGLFLLGDARQQLEGAGIFSGALANPKMTLSQYYSGLTGVPNEQLINTQVFLQQAGARAAAILQSGTYGTGTGVGQRDLDAANKLANGDNTVDLATIKRVFDLTEKTAHRKIEMFNDMIRKRDPGSVVEPPPASASASTAGSLDFSRMSLPDLTAAVTRGDLTIDQRKAIDKRFRELGH